ncbi:hypothetical protein [Anaeromyxobacter oryzae]|uniref:Uncharacterized protein n=1 Tax=Anaeromyxobacter oryzae TaxID=2918170 RepID=A0ABM7X3I7_9BACT|nr:hypothetical protein [Anaeromyxobacter oryzae]BDG06327.1 hypothetical protein AMOR_53230 [Anaeromyxobacter oryzae]
MIEKLASLAAPGRLSWLLAEGARGHHPLFAPAEIRSAFETPEEVLGRDEADRVEDALLAICQEPLDVARATVDALPPGDRRALIRLYFGLLDRVGGEGERH